MSMVDEIQALIAEGEALKPHAAQSIYGSPPSTYSAMRPEFIGWRQRAVAAIEKLGKTGARLVKQIDAEKNPENFYVTSVMLVVGNLKAALALATGPSASTHRAEDEPPYDVAQVCLDGHVTNEATRRLPQNSEDYCQRCGSKTVTECPTCSTPVRGAARNTLGLVQRAPAYCVKCGTAFPWTERHSQAAIELFIEETQPTSEETEQFKQALHDIATDGPRTQIGASRFSRLMAKMKTEGAALLRTTVAEIVSETAKKIIWPTP